jgi:hypothetical protein
MYTYTYIHTYILACMYTFIYIPHMRSDFLGLSMLLTMWSWWMWIHIRYEWAQELSCYIQTAKRLAYKRYQKRNQQLDLFCTHLKNRLHIISRRIWAPLIDPPLGSSRRIRSIILWMLVPESDMTDVYEYMYFYIYIFRSIFKRYAYTYSCIWIHQYIYINTCVDIYS